MTNKEAIKFLKWQVVYAKETGERYITDCVNVEALELAVKALEAQGWIPVTERLPEECNKTFLVSVDYGKIGKSVMSLWWHNKEIGWEKGFNDSVVAWMPLPEPYTKEETT